MGRKWDWLRVLMGIMNWICKKNGQKWANGFNKRISGFDKWIKRKWAYTKTREVDLLILTTTAHQKKSKNSSINKEWNSKIKFELKG